MEIPNAILDQLIKREQDYIERNDSGANDLKVVMHLVAHALACINYARQITEIDKGTIAANQLTTALVMTEDTIKNLARYIGAEFQPLKSFLDS